MWPASLVTLASVIDNPWGVCCRRSAQVGRQLATVLLQREHGRRPVTLMGFSLGARVIFYCLLELSKRKNSAGIVQDVILLGAPVSGHPAEWKKFAEVVSGRIINGYCQKDWLLHFLYRTSAAKLHIAGLEPVKWEDRRMFNFDLSHIVTGHMDYANKLDMILKTLGIRTREPEEFSSSSMKKSATFEPSSGQLMVPKPFRRCSSSPDFTKSEGKQQNLDSSNLENLDSSNRRSSSTSTATTSSTAH